MDTSQLKMILQQGEHATVEFKDRLSSNRNVAVLLSSFANSLGGNIIIGVADNGKVLGVSDPEAVTSRIGQVCANLLAPSLSVKTETIELNDRAIVLVGVPQSSSAPHSVSGEYFIRKGSYSHPATINQVQQLIYDRAQASHDPLDVLKIQISQLLQQNHDLSKRFKESQSWRSKIVDMLIGAAIGAVVSLFIH